MEEYQREDKTITDNGVEKTNTDPNSFTGNKVSDNKTQAVVTYKTNESSLKGSRIVYFLLGLLEILFAFRLVFKLLGANPASGFVSFLYNVSGFFLAPFSGIFRSAVNSGIETKSVLEPACLIAMAVYALAGFGIVKLIKIYGTPKNKKV